MQKGVVVSTPRALPCPFGRIRLAFMDHLYYQVTPQAHCRFAVDELWLNALSHESTLL
jgi:hypothetical protein